ncbi:MAG: RNA methyltransferase [Gammaproteobacteria bacterium]|nr:RNA methyltransferase [Gammaproteobacteria bacterium]
MAIKQIDFVDIIMVGTTHPGNIGAAARAMSNMCFTNLVLVDPQCPVGETAYARSSGAHAVLDQRKTFASLPEAIEDAHLVVGMSARQRSLPWPELKPDEVTQKIQQKGSNTRAALIFGREHSGLTNEELTLCNYMVTIPTNSEFSSLNVASAIQVMCYEIYKTLSNASLPVSPPGEELATGQDIEGYFSHLEQVMLTTEFLDADNPGMLMQRLRRLYQRVDLSKTEVNILRGILSSVEKYKS